MFHRHTLLCVRCSHFKTFYKIFAVGQLNQSVFVDRCDHCNVLYSSQFIKQQHLKGSKHAKKMKLEAILASYRSPGMYMHVV